MNYPECIEYIFSSLPMFHRIGAAAYKADLSTTIRLCEHLGNPQDNFKAIHIAGTNGKGSVSSMLAAILQTAGYRTGLFTSPHLKDFRERIRINGQMIPEGEVAGFISRNKLFFDQLKPSFFEMTAGLAFEYFSKNHVEIAVIETGMGGRLDSTNLVKPVVSVITNIGLDHTQFLGDTLEKIAAEKAGIIKPEIPVMIGQTQPETEPVFREFARRLNAPVTFADQDYHLELRSESCLLTEGIRVDVYAGSQLRYENLFCQLSGHYQIKNLVTVIKTTDILNSRRFIIEEAHIRKALERVSQITGFMGRWQILSKNPLIICDTGHNEDGIREVTNQLHTLKYHRLHFVFGMVNDKDITKVLELLPKKAVYYFCKPDVPRGRDASLLAHEAAGYGLQGNVYDSVTIALKAAKSAAAPDDLIMVGGSTFVVAEAI